MDKQTQIKELLEFVNQLFHGRRSSRGGAIMGIPTKLDIEAMAEISSLRTLSPDEMPQQIERIRAKISIMQATNQIGSKDMEHIYELLDALA